LFRSFIPFSGFYESLHDSEIDQAFEGLFQDRESGDPNQGLNERAMGVINWKQVHLAYAKEYAECFGDRFELNLKFSELWSPREYNFETDRIFVELDDKDVQRLMNERVQEGPYHSVFVDLCREKFTHRSGFHSFYSPDWRDWGPWQKWDLNQVGTLVEAWAIYENGGFDQDDEIDLMEHARCNGRLEDWIFTAMPKDIRDRLNRIYQYIEDRKERA
jgi:hypothetical protein